MDIVLILCFAVPLALPFGETRRSSTRPDDFTDKEDLSDCTMITKMINELRNDTIKERNSLINIITNQQKDIEILNKNIAELLKILNLKSEIDVVGSVFKANTIDIWNTTTKASIPGVKVFLMGNPSSIAELIKILNLELENDLLVASNLLSKANTTDIWDAAAKASLSAVKFYLMENPNSINKKDENYGDYTLLHYASENGSFEMVKFLISQGSEIDPMDSFKNRTPLMLAAWNGHLSIVEYLIDHGAKVNKRNKYRAPVLQYAIEGDHLDVVKLLIERGANQNLKDRHGRTSLEYAHLFDKPLIVNYLSSI